MIKQSVSSMYRHEVEKIIVDEEVFTASDLLDQIYGTYDTDYRTEHDLVIKRKWVKSTSTLMARINSLWVYPLFILIMPFRYVLFGNAKVSEDSRFGKILIWLVGELR